MVVYYQNYCNDAEITMTIYWSGKKHFPEFDLLKAPINITRIGRKQTLHLLLSTVQSGKNFKEVGAQTEIELAMLDVLVYKLPSGKL